MKKSKRGECTDVDSEFFDYRVDFIKSSCLLLIRCKAPNCA